MYSINTGFIMPTNVQLINAHKRLLDNDNLRLRICALQRGASHTALETCKLLTLLV